MPLIVWWVVGGGWGVFLRNIKKNSFFLRIKFSVGFELALYPAEVERSTGYITEPFTLLCMLYRYLRLSFGVSRELYRTGREAARCVVGGGWWVGRIFEKY